MPSLNAAGVSALVTKHEWPNGDAIVTSALSNGPTFLFIEWALALRLNRKTRRKMTQLCAARAARPRPRWYKMFCKQIWHLYVQLRHITAPRKRLRERTSLSLNGRDRRQLSATGLVRHTLPSMRSQSDRAAARLWDSIKNHATVMWMDNWYHAQFTVHPTEPDVSKNVTVIALLHIIDVRPFTGHRTLDDLVQNIDATAQGIRQQCAGFSDAIGAVNGQAVARTWIRVPLDIARNRWKRLHWQPMLISELKCGMSAELVQLLTLVRGTQQHTGHTMPLLIDCAIHYSVAKLLYSRHTVTYNLHQWLGAVPLNFGVWHAYKSVMNITYRHFLPLLTYILHPRGGAGLQMRNHPRLATLESTVAALLLNRHILSPLIARKLVLLRGRAQPHDDVTKTGIRTLEGLRLLLDEYVPGLCIVGQVVRECTWTGRQAGSGHPAHTILRRCLLMLLALSRGAANRVDYVRTISIALLLWQQHQTDLPAAAHVEENNEANLSRLVKRCKKNPAMYALEDANTLFRTLPPRTDVALVTAVYNGLIAMFNACGSRSWKKISWSGGKTSAITEEDDHSYVYPASFLTEVPTQPALCALLRRFTRTLCSGRAPNAEVLQFLQQNVPHRGPANFRETRAALVGLRIRLDPVARARAHNALEDVPGPVPDALRIPIAHRPNEPLDPDPDPDPIDVDDEDDD